MHFPPGASVLRTEYRLCEHAQQGWVSKLLHSESLGTEELKDRMETLTSVGFGHCWLHFYLHTASFLLFPPPHSSFSFSLLLPPNSLTPTPKAEITGVCRGTQLEKTH